MTKLQSLMIALVLWGFLTTSAPAEIHVADSLEWMTMRTPLILRAKVLTVTQKKPASEEQPMWTIETVNVQVEEILKSASPIKTDSLSFVRIHTSYVSAQEWMGHDMIFFLRPGKEEGYGINFSDQWTLAYDYPYGPIDLSAVDKSIIVRADMTVPKTAEEVFNVIRSWAKREMADLTVSANPGAESEKTGLLWETFPGTAIKEVPEDSAAFKVLWSGSSCYLIVPVISAKTP